MYQRMRGYIIATRDQAAAGDTPVLAADEGEIEEIEEIVGSDFSDDRTDALKYGEGLRASRP